MYNQQQPQWPQWQQPMYPPAPPKSTKKWWVIAGATLLILAAFSLALQASQPTATTIVVPTTRVAPATPTPAKPVKWSTGWIEAFHSSDFLPYDSTPAFTVPPLWRIYWFCQPPSDATQAFLGVDVQQGGSNATNETPLQIDCVATPYGTQVEQVSGSVTLSVWSSSGTNWDLFIQTPQ